ncbi:MAG: MMPL family transporter [Solirubrobacteraceae bacterium]
MNGLTRWVLAHKRLVVAFWVLATVAGMAASADIGNRLDKKFSVPGREGSQTNQAILHLYGTGGNADPIVAVTTLPAGRTVDTPGVRGELGAAFGRVAAAVPGGRAASWPTTGYRGFVSADGRTTFALIEPPAGTAGPDVDPATIDAARAAAAASTVAGAPVHLTGTQVLSSGKGAKGGGPGVLVEAVLGGVGALAVLAFVFASFIALVPLIMAIVSILTTFLVIYGLTEITTVSFIVQFLVALIGLGVAIDYALLIVVRWREERQKGADNETAVVTAMEHAGRAVLFSGSTVAIGLLALVVLPVPFLRSVGYGGMLIPLVSVLVAVTLLPVILATIGPRLDWPRIRRDDQASRFWTGWAELVVRRRGAAAGVALVILVALLIPATHLYPGDPKADSLSTGGDARTGLVALERSGLGSGVLTPFEVLVGGGSSSGAVAGASAAVTGVRAAVAPAGPAWHRAGTSVVTVVPTEDGNSQAGRDTLGRLRAAIHPLPGAPRVGGPAAGGLDFVDAVYGSFPLMIGLIVIVTFILLARAFRSIVLPLKAVILNVMSVGAAYGLITLVWQDGYGSNLLFGIEATGAITAFVPLMVFAFLFGLSMDYEVFILARMRDEYDRTGSTRTAVVEGLGRTGRLVTCAALILFLAFIALASAPGNDIKVLATALGVGILIDATIVRALLVPSLVALLGEWNWWLPAWLARPLRVEPSPRRPEPVDVPGQRTAEQRLPVA